MSEPELNEEKYPLLKSQITGMLTTVRVKDGMLSTNPVSFTLDDGKILISTLKSRMKYRNILADNRVAFCVQSFSNIMDYLEIRGHATVQDDPDASLVHRQFMSSFGEPPPADLDPPGAERVIITIHPEQVSAPTLYGGRFDQTPPDEPAS